MDRSRSAFRVTRRGLVAALLIASLTATGCTGPLLTAMYLIKGTDVDPEFGDLKDKKVVVVCRPSTTIEFKHANACRELSVELSRLLAAKVKKIEVVDIQDVTAWTDENMWDEPTEVGEALDAQMVVAVDIHNFSLYESLTIFQGKSEMTITVYDMEDEGRIVYETSPAPSAYPPNIGIPTSDKSKMQFERQFVGSLADEIGRHFYPHDYAQQYARDSLAFD